jgi:hypothetical protein
MARIKSPADCPIEPAAFPGLHRVDEQERTAIGMDWRSCLKQIGRGKDHDFLIGLRFDGNPDSLGRNLRQRGGRRSWRLRMPVSRLRFAEAEEPGAG